MSELVLQFVREGDCFVSGSIAVCGEADQFLGVSADRFTVTFAEARQEMARYGQLIPVGHDQFPRGGFMLRFDGRTEWFHLSLNYDFHAALSIFGYRPFSISVSTGLVPVVS